MCDPSTLAKATLAGSASSETANILSAVGSSLGRKRAAKANEAQATINAEQAALRGEQEVRKAGIATGRLFGKQRASFAANGIDIAGSPTALNILADTAEEGVREGQQIRDNAADEHRAFMTEAAFSRAAAKAESPLLAGVSSALGGAGRVASKWYAFKKAGVI